MALGELLSVFQRHIQVGNDRLALRKEIAAELVANCERWSELLVVMLEAARASAVDGRTDEAMAIIQRQQADFLSLDYHSVRNGSPSLVFLGEDARFEHFIAACNAFYYEAVDLKQLVRGELWDIPKIPQPERHGVVTTAVEKWHERVERLLMNVRSEGAKVKVLVPM